MTIEAIKEEIGLLSDQERRLLLDWLEEVDEDAWDRQMERDLASESGVRLAEKIDRRIDQAIETGNATSLEDGLRARRERRAQK